RICRRLKSSVDRCQNDRRQQQTNTVGDVAHDDEQRCGNHLYLAADTLIEKLVHREQLAAEVSRDEEDRDYDSPHEVAKDELQKLKVSTARERDARNRDERDRRGFGG